MPRLIRLTRGTCTAFVFALTSLLVLSAARPALADPDPDELIGNYREFANDSSHGADYLLGQAITVTDSCTLARFGLVSRSANKARMALYTDAGGHPGSLVAATDAFQTSRGRVEAPAVGEPELNPGTYWLVAAFDATAQLAQEDDGTTRMTAYITYDPQSPVPQTMTNASMYGSPSHWTYYMVIEKDLERHSCALGLSGGIKCWGSNANGELGLGDLLNRGAAANQMGSQLPQVDLGSQFHVRKTVTGGDFSCAISEANTVKCWGKNRFGQLGLGDTRDRGAAPTEMGDALPTVDLGAAAQVQDLALGSRHACALLSNGSVKCWGQNDKGQLGQGDANPRGSSAQTMGDNLHAVDLGQGRSVKQLAIGGSHTCALLDNNAVKCWGSGSSGQLGNGKLLAGTAATDMGDHLDAVNFGAQRETLSLVSGDQHSCVLFRDGDIKCWGSNLGGELGLGDTLNRGMSLDDMGEQLPRTRVGDDLPARDLQCGGHFCCAIMVNKAMKCWGRNDKGQLGLGDLTSRGADPDLLDDNLPYVRMGRNASVQSIRLGADFSCATLDSGKVKCWGGNAYGQLGLGDTTNRGGTSTSIPELLPDVSL